MPVDYEVSGIINPVDQGNSNLCWLASTATLLSWKLLRLMDLRQTARHLGPEFERLFTSGDALRATDIPLFLQRARLVAKVGQSRPASSWEALLRSHGLLAVGIDADNPNNYMTHLVIIYAIKGDETLDGTTVRLIDPAGGRRLAITFRRFGQLYGADDAVNLPFNVFHSA